MPNSFLERELGDQIESALGIIGITSERITKWIGAPCGCPERKEKLNQLSRWARRVLSGKVDKAKQYLDQMLDE